MNVAFLQYAPAYLQVEANLAYVEQLLRGTDADLVVLPELFASGYFFQSEQDLAAVAESVPDGPTTQRLIQWAKASGATLVAGLPERDTDGKIYNSAAIVTPDGYLATYRKNHLFYEEKRFFSPGNLGFPVFDLRSRDGIAYRLGVMICFDWIFPESARSLALQGADIIAHPANLVLPHCPQAMPIRALENHVFTITSNRYGKEVGKAETLTFIGQSEICVPNGAILLRAPDDDDMVGVVEIDPHVARARQITKHNHLFGDRRTETYITDALGIA